MSQESRVLCGVCGSYVAIPGRQANATPKASTDGDVDRILAMVDHGAEAPVHDRPAEARPEMAMAKAGPASRRGVFLVGIAIVALILVVVVVLAAR